jgi:hypothetical protein
VEIGESRKVTPAPELFPRTANGSGHASPDLKKGRSSGQKTAEYTKKKNPVIANAHHFIPRPWPTRQPWGIPIHPIPSRLILPFPVPSVSLQLSLTEMIRDDGRELLLLSRFVVSG